MSFGQRLWFLVMTAVYMVVVGLFGGSITQAAHNLWVGQPTPDRPDFSSPDAMLGIVVWGTVVLMLQTYRVVASIRRAKVQPVRPCRGFLNMQTFMHFKVILLLLAVPLVAWIAHSVLNP